MLAHELMHVRHRDILIGSVAAAIATAISFVAQMAMFAAMFGGGGRRRGRQPHRRCSLHRHAGAPGRRPHPDGGQSRQREFDADRGAAELLGTGEPLARALERIEAGPRSAHGQVTPAGLRLDPQPAGRGGPAAPRRAPTWPAVLHAPVDRRAHPPPPGHEPGDGLTAPVPRAGSRHAAPASPRSHRRPGAARPVPAGVSACRAGALRHVRSHCSRATRAIELGVTRSGGRSATRRVELGGVRRRSR